MEARESDKVVGIDDPVRDYPNMGDVINEIAMMKGKKESKASPAKNLASQSLIGVQMKKLRGQSRRKW